MTHGRVNRLHLQGRGRYSADGRDGLGELQIDRDDTRERIDVELGSNALNGDAWCVHMA